MRKWKRPARGRNHDRRQVRLWHHRLRRDCADPCQGHQGLRPDVKVLIREDERRQYGEVMTIMKAAYKANITSVTLVNRPET